MPPNASRITGKVLTRTVWSAGTLPNTPPTVALDQTLYSLRVEILTVEPETPGVPSLARPGLVIEAFSSGPLPADLVGQTIQATVSLTGYVRYLWWWIDPLR